MKQLILFSLFIFMSFVSKSQVSYNFMIEELPQDKTYEGVYEPFSAKDAIYRLIRVNNASFKKRDLKRFVNFKKEYLNELNAVISEDKLREQLVLAKKTYQQVKHNKHEYTFEYKSADKVYVELVDVYYFNRQLEKAVIYQYNPRSNKKTKLFVIHFFNYS